MVLRSKSFKRPRLLIAGAGDIGLRVLDRLRTRYRVFALTSQPERLAALREAGAVPLLGNLDDRRSLRRLAGLAPRVAMLVPPPTSGDTDPRSRQLALTLARPAAPSRKRGIVAEGGRITRVIYVSTTGVYGDCGGARVRETRPVAPRTARARRRVDAERIWRAFGARGGRRVTLLRVPGIYGRDRLPLDRLKKGLPALRPEEDVYTSHIEAGDLARIVIAALHRGAPQRVLHAVDDSTLRMGEYFDRVADACGLPRPPRRSRAEIEATVSPAMLSFMAESRRLSNERLKRELRVRLRWATVEEALADWFGGRGT